MDSSVKTTTEMEMTGQQGRKVVTIISTTLASIQAPPNKRPTIYIYPAVTPESIVIPIVSCILGFPILALMVICCLRRRAKLARERERRRNCDLEHGRRRRPVSLFSDHPMTRGFPSLELDTVFEERSDADLDATSLDLMTPEKSNGSLTGQGNQSFEMDTVPLKS